MDNDKVAISVIMSVYNTRSDYLNIAVQSILNQSFRDFEFIIIDDGSGEECRGELRKFKDERIRLITNPRNYGLTRSLNIGLREACGRYIARMDADDYSLPKRFERQYHYMEKHKEIQILGAWVKEGKRIQKCCGNVSSKWRYTRMLFDNVGIFHPTAFIRGEFLRRNGFWYDESYEKAQDFELWSRCLRVGYMYVYPEVLLNYRIHEGQISRGRRGEQAYFDICTRERMLAQLDVELSEKERHQFANMDESSITAPEMEMLFDRLLEGNRQKKIFDSTILRYELYTKWIRYILKAKRREKRNWMRRKYAAALLNIRYYVYMIFIAWCKQDLFHHNREKRI